MRYTLIGCGARKREHPCAAEEIYTGGLFRAQVGYARQHARPFYILSALHGVLHPRRVIAPYDATLTTAAARAEWTERVTKQLLELTQPGDVLEVTAGENYLGWVPALEAEGRIVELPLRGKSLGLRRSILGRLTR